MGDDDFVKKEVIKDLLQQMISVSSNLTGEVITIDDIEKELIVNKMFEVCKSSAVDMLTVDEFMKTELYKTYVESIGLMTQALIKHIAERAIVDKTIH